MFALLATLLTAAPHPRAPQGEWELLGRREVSFRAERDVISVTAREGTFRALKLEVEGGNLEMFNIRVTFGDGSVFSPDTRIQFREGSWSRTLDLPGAARVVRKVEFYYRSEGRRGRANVRLYGMQGTRAPEHAEDRPEPARRFEGWDELGARTVSFRAERDVISARGEGAFRRIMIAVEDADMELFNVRVVFANGEVFSPETRLYFREDSRTRVIDLPGAARAIRRVEFSYKSVRGGGDGRAVVHLYAR